MNTAFEDFLRTHGFHPEVVLPDSQIRRCFVDGDRAKSVNGWFILNTDGCRQWGVCGSNKTGEKFNWSGGNGDTGVTKVRTERFRQPVVTDRRRLHAIWNRAVTACPNHPYLELKRVPPIGIRQEGKALIVPMRSIDGDLMGLQRIKIDSSKAFISGSQTKGAMHWLGSPGPKILIAEGYATAASIFMATKLPTVAAFAAGNLMEVGKALRHHHPDAHLIFMADEDGPQAHFVGQQKAQEAAQAVDGDVLLPSQVFKTKE